MWQLQGLLPCCCAFSRLFQPEGLPSLVGGELCLLLMIFFNPNPPPGLHRVQGQDPSHSVCHTQSQLKTIFDVGGGGGGPTPTKMKKLTRSYNPKKKNFFFGGGGGGSYPVPNETAEEQFTAAPGDNVQPPACSNLWPSPKGPRPSVPKWH
jgi:hypothetical protein